MQPTVRVFVDSNVLYSRTQRDWLGLLYSNPTPQAHFRVHWSEDVLADVIHHLRKNKPDLSGRAIAHVRDRVATTFEVGRVADYDIDGSYRGGDPHDAHIHAAATACRADYLLTNNVKDFPDGPNDPLPYEVIRPDDFFVLVDDAYSDLVAACVEEQIRYWSQRPTDQVDLLGPLQKANCPAFAERVRAHLQRRAFRP